MTVFMFLSLLRCTLDIFGRVNHGREYELEILANIYLHDPVNVTKLAKN